MKLGNVLRKIRNQKKISQSELAEQVGVSQSTYCAWESDRSLPNARSLRNLATILAVDISELLPDDLTLTIHADSTRRPAELNAKTLYEELTASQKQMIWLQQQRIDELEAEIQRLKAQLQQGTIS